jgi:hypothetical protein
MWLLTPSDFAAPERKLAVLGKNGNASSFVRYLKEELSFKPNY